MNRLQSSVAATYKLEHGVHSAGDERSGDLVEGIENEDVWRFIRRFNKQIFHLKESHAQLSFEKLDFNVAEEEEFSPNKFRAQIERFYMGVLLGLLGFLKQLARLRSWREPRRTALFCMTYFAAWVIDILGPLFIAATAALIASPWVRTTMFPPAPLAMVDYKTGGVTKPSAGILGSVDSATGAPENYKGESVENEASNFVTGLAAIAMNILTDEDPQHGKVQEEDEKTGALPTPNKMAISVAVIKDKAAGVARPSLDKTKSPMETTMWSSMRPIMHLLCHVSNNWERFANLCVPVGPFSNDKQRQRLAVFFIPIFIFSLFVDRHILYRSLTLVGGLGLFGHPILTRAYTWFDLKTFRINNTILKDVPTDVQIAISILRIREVGRTPLPPLPQDREMPVDKPSELTEDLMNTTAGDQLLGATDEELREAAAPDEDMISKAGGGDHEAPETDNNKHDKWRGRAVQFVRFGAKAMVKTAIGVDKMRAKAGTESAKNRLGAVPSKDRSPDLSPSVFEARHHGENGYVYLTLDLESPCVCFSTGTATNTANYQESKLVWTVPINDITTLNKHHGYGTKSKLLAGWALEREIMDGLEIVDRHGNQKVLTAVPHRDELFNRLCAIGKQKWEIW